MEAPAPTEPQTEPRDRRIALILCTFLGLMGMHRFYTGHTGIGVAQLLSFGGCGLWWLYDLLMLASGRFADAEGVILR